MRSKLIWILAWLAGCIALGTVIGSARAAITLSDVAGVPVYCAHASQMGPYEGWGTPEGVILRRGICESLMRSKRGDDEPWAWIIFGHEIGHARGMVHEQCPTPTTFGITHAAMFAAKLGKPPAYRRWLRTQVRMYLGMRLVGEINCTGALGPAPDAPAPDPTT